MSFTSKMRQRLGDRLDAVRPATRQVDADRPPLPPEPSRAPRDAKPVSETVWYQSARWVAESARWVATTIYAALSRPRTRLVIIGVVLFLIAILKLFSSVWTIPLVIVGALMVIIAWVGARLDGRIGIVWGEDGTEFEMRARLKPARPAALSGVTSTHTAPTVTHSTDADTIDGEAHTMAIDVAELKALIAAIEAGESPSADDGSAQTNTNTNTNTSDVDTDPSDDATVGTVAGAQEENG
jgi:hypothetical protein